MASKKKEEKIYLGKTPLNTTPQPIRGKVVDIDGTPYYRIENYDHMSDFFLSVISDSDVWMFLSSTGALTAGRRNPDNALFPYYNDDRIHDSQDITGSKTLIRVTLDKKNHLWEPFSTRYEGVYDITRNIYKRPLGNDIIFEEINHDLKLNFHYRWTNCDRFGIVREAAIINRHNNKVTIRLLDGIQNILPAGVDRGTQLGYSTLLDGYKKNELLTDNGIGVYTLSSLLTDKAEPAESLRSTLVWSAGLHRDNILLSSVQLDDFRKGRSVRTETDMRARRGAYFIDSSFELNEGRSKKWFILADLKQDAVQLSALRNFLDSEPTPENVINEELLKSDIALEKIVARGDGLQLGRDRQSTFRHFSVSLFNIMRGGIFENNYRIRRNDFLKFIRTSNIPLYKRYPIDLEKLPETFNRNDMIERFHDKDPDLERLCYEYLPLSFSRRHGDPSRPWNDFSIDIRDEDGNRTLNYQGNWRDLFQNWESLALSFPEFIESMISKFVNSTTADGYNPYRLTRDGFEWEAPDPDMPFANIGYWGDHQIIYLLKLLKLSHHYHPGKLRELLTREIFTYANVPYRIKPYEALLKDPQNTIDFDTALHRDILNSIKSEGTDAQRLHGTDGSTRLVNLTEKLMVPLLVKLSNFIPGAGIWMNTQRPEWNDANNSLVGFGVSMVTLYYLRDHIEYLSSLFGELDQEKISVSEEVDELFSGIYTTFIEHKDMLDSTIADKERKIVLDKLGKSGSEYRSKLYTKGFSGEKIDISKKDILGFFSLALTFIDHSISLNKRKDGLYHAYNVISMKDDAVSVRFLYEMLEGQVAILSSGYLSADESLDLLISLRKSKLYRRDQRAYILYPDRELPRFTEKNIIPETLLKKSDYMTRSLNERDTRIVKQDPDGKAHFNAAFSNGRLLEQALAELKLPPSETAKILNIYESVFDHQSFTGRSGTFYKYEGLGCIYWHMASKLLLAVQDTFYRALDKRADMKVLNGLRSFYYEIREGIGSHKNPEEYGAFPMDPYSHTP
ncbi:MAG: hypothetical protein K0B52_03785, partial [FCB group bacterium]|nr:hypothetical protein [FCB group bacterium]